MKKTSLIIGSCTYVHEDNKIYAICLNYNILFSISDVDGKIELLSSIPKKNIFAEALSLRICHVKGRLFFIPADNDDIWIYDLNTKEWQTIVENIDRRVYNFMDAIVYGKYIYAIGWGYNGVLRIDTDSLEVKDVEGFRNDELNLPGSDPLSLAMHYMIKDGDCAYGMTMYKHYAQFNLNDETVSWKMFNGDIRQASGCLKRGSDIYISPRGEGEFCVWDGDDEIEMHPLPGFVKDPSKGAISIYPKDNKIVLPLGNDRELIWNGEKLIQGQNICCYSQQLDDNVYAFQNLDGLLEIYDASELIISQKCEIDTDVLHDYSQRWNNSIDTEDSNVINEGLGCTIENLLELL